MANAKSEAAKAKNADKTADTPAGGTTTDTTAAGAASQGASNGKGQNISVHVAMTNNAAKDDLFTADNTEWLTEAGGLTGTLDVLANDPGSAHLFAIHGEAPSGGGVILPSDFSEPLTITVEVEGTEYELIVSVNDDGTLEVDASSLSGLADGDTAEVSFYYTAQMGNNGALSTAMVTIEVSGESSEPVFSGDDTGVVQEDGTPENGGTQEAGGTLVVEDADAADTGFQAVADADLVGEFGDFTFDETTGEWTYVLRNDDDNVQALNTGDMPTDTLTVLSADGTEHDIVVTVEGVDEDTAAAAPQVVESFETGLTGLLTIGSVATTGDVTTGSGATLTPTDGTQMAGLSTESDFGGTAATTADIETFLGLSVGTLGGVGDGNATGGSAVQTSVTLAAGETISFDYFFDTTDSLPKDDTAFLSLTGGGTTTLADVALVGDGGESAGWQTYNFTATDAGTYDLGIGVLDSTDATAATLLFLDNFVIF